MAMTTFDQTAAAEVVRKASESSSDRVQGRQLGEQRLAARAFRCSHVPRSARVMSAVQVGVGVLASRSNPTSLLNGSSGGDSVGKNTNSSGQANATPAPTSPDFAHNGALRLCRPAISAVEILYEILDDSKGVDGDRVTGGNTNNAKSKKNEKKPRASGSGAFTTPSLQVTRLMLEAIMELINRYPDEKSWDSGSTIHNNIVKALGVAEQSSE
ncbi:hypothetical protein N7539_004669 [Penicillium diatomitis]|uniref:Uncharacterized protein n=1 Tax=Penicillium diatomitis TaxID=2819901 RepID=A0A9X0BYP5_9EURO|nr:uncharacterized protein N7539_004669 [Penicillium diatomitis]KAJ5489779.1 hypothetical protein N7539_004669 [Penicillium diatomitis]